MTNPAPAADRLEISTARLIRTNGLALLIGVVCVAVVAFPAASLASGGSLGNLALVAIFLAGGGFLIRLGYTQVVLAKVRLPTIEATEDVVRMRDNAGRDFEVSRARVDRVVWQHQLHQRTPGKRPASHLMFYDSAGEPFADWDVGQTAGRAAVPWLRRLGMTVTEDASY